MFKQRIVNQPWQARKLINILTLLEFTIMPYRSCKISIIPNRKLLSAPGLSIMKLV